MNPVFFNFIYALEVDGFGAGSVQDKLSFLSKILKKT